MDDHNKGNGSTWIRELPLLVGNKPRLAALTFATFAVVMLMLVTLRWPPPFFRAPIAWHRVPAPPPSPKSAVLSTTSYFVSKRGTGGDGRNWATAWDELDRVNWSVIRPGDTVFIDGGSPVMTYTTSLTVGSSGTPDKPIRIALSSEAGRNGKAVIDGGLRYWPCQATEKSPYTENPPPGTRRFGIDLNGQEWIAIDGTKWGGIEIENHNEGGVRFHRARNVRLTNLHIHHNTYPNVADGPGIAISGDNIILEKLDIHNNGQDAIQGGDVSNLILQDSYLHDHYCSHPDGIQLYRGANHNITIRRNTFTAGLLQAVFLGEQNPALDSTTSDVQIYYNVIYNTRYGIVSNHRKNRNWKVFNNTIVDVEHEGIDLFASGGGMEVRNNILDNGSYVLRNGIQSNNLFYHVPYAPLEDGSFRADPQFVDKDAKNFQLRESSPAIDQGIDVGLNNDKLGDVVPAGKGVDIGAFEYGSGPPSPSGTTP